MAKLTVLYKHPDSVEAFGEYYFERHLPLAQEMPGVKNFELNKIVATVEGEESPYFRIAEMWYESVEELRDALDSEQGRKILADVPNYATGETVMLISESD